MENKRILEIIKPVADRIYLALAPHVDKSYTFLMKELIQNENDAVAIQYLKNQKLINSKYENLITAQSTESYPTLKISISKEFLKFYKSLPSQKERLITKDATGRFYFNGKTLNLSNDRAIYYKIFDCLFQHSLRMNENEVCAYEEINAYLVTHGKAFIKTKKDIRKRISNGLIDLYRFSNLPKFLLNGDKLIITVKGLGLNLNNPTI